MKKAHVYAIPAIGAALIAVLAQISLPIGPVPFTLQNFAIGLISTVVRIFLANLLGDTLVFVGGIIGLHFLAGMAFEKALVVGVIPFIIPDLGKIIAISFISRPLLQRLKNQAYFAN